MNSLFSVAVNDDDPPRWTVVCDRCGRELDVDGLTLMIFQIVGFDEMRAARPDVFDGYIRLLRKQLAGPDRMMFVDADVKITESKRGLAECILNHRARCS